MRVAYALALIPPLGLRDLPAQTRLALNNTSEWCVNPLSVTESTLRDELEAANCVQHPAQPWPNAQDWCINLDTRENTLLHNSDLTRYTPFTYMYVGRAMILVYTRSMTVLK